MSDPFVVGRTSIETNNRKVESVTTSIQELTKRRLLSRMLSYEDDTKAIVQLGLEIDRTLVAFSVRSMLHLRWRPTK